MFPQTISDLFLACWCEFISFHSFASECGWWSLTHVRIHMRRRVISMKSRKNKNRYAVHTLHTYIANRQIKTDNYTSISHSMAHLSRALSLSHLMPSWRCSNGNITPSISLTTFDFFIKSMCVSCVHRFWLTRMVKRSWLSCSLLAASRTHMHTIYPYTLSWLWCPLPRYACEPKIVTYLSYKYLFQDSTSFSVTRVLYPHASIRTHTPFLHMCQR